MWKTKSIRVFRASSSRLWKGSYAGFWREAAETLGRAEERKEAWKRLWVARQALSARLPPLHTCDSAW